MTNSLYISTTEAGSGKALASMGIINLILRKTSNVSFFRPIIRKGSPAERDEDIDLILTHFNLPQTYDESYGLYAKQANELLGQHHVDLVIEKIITQFKALEQRSDFIVCEGSDFLRESSAFEFDLNQEIAKNLGCPILLLGNADQRSLEDAIQPIQIAVDAHRDRNAEIAGIILNKAAPDQVEALKSELELLYDDTDYTVAVIPYDRRLSSPRVRDIAHQLSAEVLYGHTRLDSLAASSIVAAMQMQHALNWLQEDCLVITPGDRGDVIVGVLQAHQSMNYPKVAGLLLSTGFRPEPSIAKLIEGLPDPPPILSVKTDTYTTASQVQAVHSTLRPGDQEKIHLSIEAFDQHVDLAKFEQQLSTIQVQGLTPKMFTYNLVQQAKSNKQHIVLPESTDPRILQASAILLERDIVDLTLLGRYEEIDRVCKGNGIQLDLDALSIVDPATSHCLEDYAHTFYELRKHKGATLDAARDYVMDSSYFGTMMVYCDDASGMVSGAVHTTQHTIRPALQVIKTKADFSIVSSIFFMCLDQHVLVYGDCAVNPNPTAPQLAEIAITSAETAKMFGIEPRVALLSYSSGDSGKGDDVEKVRQATHIAQQLRPDLLLEGPIQYDAAVDKSVAAQKMPGSQVAGLATVFIFPDLNTGNNTYKAVQRETGAIAIGPILQGLKKPVNDLSRGCTVEDVVNTVVITAVQAQARVVSQKQS